MALNDKYLCRNKFVQHIFNKYNFSVNVERNLPLKNLIFPHLLLKEDFHYNCAKHQNC